MTELGCPLGGRVFCVPCRAALLGQGATLRELSPAVGGRTGLLVRT
jgi:hypothetical protein